MESIENVTVGYQFNAVPLNLMACCDLNCRSMLWTLVQLSSYYAAEDGWFFRTNEDLRTQSLLSENLVRATLSTLYNVGVIDVQTVGKGKSKTPNRFILRVERFADWEKYSLEDCIKHPDLRIETDNYKAKEWQPSYLGKLDIETVKDSVDIPISQPIPSQSEDNIENINNKENKLSEASKQVEIRSNKFEEYKMREDELMDKLYHVTTWTDFKTFRKQIDELISTAYSERIAEKTKKRFTSIAEGKIKFLKGKISKEPYNSFFDDFYREYDCGWLGKEAKEKKQVTVQPQHQEEDENADLRATFEAYGWEVPDNLKPKRPQQEGQDFRPFDDDNLPF